MTLTKEIILRTIGLSKTFSSTQSFIRNLIGRRGSEIKAVDNVDLQIEKSEILGLVGESGCGKTTTGRLIAMLETPTSGQIYYRNYSVSQLHGKKMKKTCRQNVQMIFQDPYGSLDPRLIVRTAVQEPLNVFHRDVSAGQRLKLVREALEEVELSPADKFLDKFPHELSGGQRQRVAVARSIVLKPELIVADEPVSMLDASVRVGVLKSLLNLRQNLGASFLFITHDLAIARYACDKIAVMYLGRIVEKGKTEEVIGGAQHPYTQLLLSAAPEIRHDHSDDHVILTPEIEADGKPVEGCKFYPRCPSRFQECSDSPPQLVKINEEHCVACHLMRSEKKEKWNEG